ncbi:MAG: hypothetical protein MUF58_13480 [Arcicella sp.]|jgi:hypothetical protein|nr:hypothetical protein [Arcicella sp.]
MNSFVRFFTGRDEGVVRILNLHQDINKNFNVLAVMAFANVLLACISGYYLGSQSHFSVLVPYVGSLLMGYFVGVFQLFIFQTVENDLAYFNQYEAMRKVGIRKVEIIRVLLMIFIGVFVLQGIKLFLFADGIELFCAKLETAKIDPRVLDLTKNDVQQQLHRSMLHKLLMVEMIYETRPWILWAVNACVMILFALPVVYRTMTQTMLYSEYEIAKQDIETQMVIEDYEQTMNAQRWVLWKNFEIYPQRYEAFADAPFNTLRIYPPVIENLIWDEQDLLWKKKS